MVGTLGYTSSQESSDPMTNQCDGINVWSFQSNGEQLLKAILVPELPVELRSWLSLANSVLGASILMICDELTSSLLLFLLISYLAPRHYWSRVP